MPNGQQQAYDLSSAAKDQDFLHAPTQDKIAFLAAHDPDFAKASKSDQAAYLNHILGNDEPTQFEKDVAARPNALERFSETMLGTRHPIDDLVAEGKSAYHHPVELLKSAGETAGIPRAFWANPSREYLNLGGTGIPGMVFGEHGLLKSPLEFGENFTGAKNASEDIQNKNYGAIPGDIAGGLVNLALAKRPAESGGAYLANTARNAKAGIADVIRTPENKLTPTVSALSRVGGAALGHYVGLPGAGELAGVFGGPSLADALLPKRAPATNFYEGAYSPYAGESPKPVPITKSPYFDRGAYQAGRAPNAPIVKTSPFGDATSSASPSFNASLPEVPSTPTPQPKVAGINATPTEVEAGVKGSIAKPSGRLVLSPEEARAESVMQDIATRRAKQHGMLYAAGMRPAGGGRVPMTPTPTETFEYPQRSAYEPPEAPYSRGGGAGGPYAPPDYAYRAHDVGNYDTDPASHAHATESEAEAQTYAQSRNAGTPQQVSKINLGKMGPGGFEVYEGPNGKKWYRFKRPLTSEDYEQ